VLSRINQQNYEESRAFIYQVPLFSDLTDIEKSALVTSLNYHKFNIGDKMVTEGENGDLFYIIKDGSVVVTQNEKELRKMHKGEFFGD
jgi:signal-transduction protein with cAMP-binding, CBS, and nucleotidyltransferase domain